MDSSSCHSIALPDQKSHLVAPSVTAVDTLLAPPSDGSTKSDLLQNGAEPKKAAAKKTKKVSDAPAKPRPPRVRKKPSDPPSPRSRAKPPAACATPPIIINTQNPSDQIKVLQTGFLNQNVSCNGVTISSPNRTARVLLPKPATGQVASIRPLAAQSVPNNHVQFQNGMVMLTGQTAQQQQQQQFVSFRNTNGQFQSADAAATVNKSASTGGHHQLLQNTGKPQQMVMVNSVGNASGQNVLQMSTAPRPASGALTQQAGKIVYFNASQSQQPQQMPTISLPQAANAAGTVQVRLQVIQTPNGPITVAFMPDQNGTFNHASAQLQQRIPPQPNHVHDQDGLNRAANMNFVFQQQQSQQQRPLANNLVSVSALANACLPPAPTPPVATVEEKVEPEFNLEEFLMPGMFTTPSVSTASSLQSNQSILEELVSGPMFQSPVQPPSAKDTPPPAKAKRKRPPKKDTSNVKQVQIVEFKTVQENRNLKKVEEILKSYAEEKSRSVVVSDALPSQPFLLSTPPAGSDASSAKPSPVSVLPEQVPSSIPPATTKASPVKTPKASAPSRVSVPVQPAVVPAKRPPTPPPPVPVKPPPKPKTDLAVRLEKDEKLVEKMWSKPFKGPNSAVNRLLPFHLLSTPEESLELVDLEARAFHQVALSLADRQAALYSRFGQHVSEAAAEPISKLDVLSYYSTWLDMERAELEADRLALQEGVERRPPVWVYTDLQLDSHIPYHDGNLLLGFTEPVLDVPSPPPPPPAPPTPQPADPRPYVTAVLSDEPGGKKLKLRIKRPAPPPTTAQSAVEGGPPAKKLSLKFRMSANAGWVVGRPLPAMEQAPPLPMVPQVVVVDGPMEDVITRNAVDSILNVDGVRAPVMVNGGGGGGGSGLDDLVFEVAGQQFGEMETDTALNEAINSILS